MIDHRLVDRLRHVVDGQRGDAWPPSAPPSRHRSARSSRRSPRSRRRRRRPRGARRSRSAASGWQSGISSLVRLAAMIPASWAVVSASPFGSSPRRATVSGAISTVARATARRRESGLSPTSTIRTAPSGSTCERPLIARHRTGARAHAVSAGTARAGSGRALGERHLHDPPVGAAAEDRERDALARGEPRDRARDVLGTGDRACRRCSTITSPPSETSRPL